MGETSKQSTSSFVFGDNSFDVLRIFSALLIEMSYQRNGLKGFWKKRFLKVCIPFWIVELVGLLITQQFEIKKYLLDAVFISPATGYGWFMQYIVICYILFFSVKMMSEKLRVNEMWILIVAFAVWFIADSCFFADSGMPFLRARQMLSFPLGVMIAKNREKIERYSTRKRTVILVWGGITGILFMAITQLSVVKALPYFVSNVMALFTVLPLAIAFIAFVGKAKVLSEGTTTTFQYDLIDNNQKDLEWWTAKHNWYSNREVLDHQMTLANQQVETLESGGQSSGQASMKRAVKNGGYYKLPKFWRAHIYFIYRYYIKLGFLDGPEGKIFHFLQAYWYRFLVDAKLYECEKKGITMKPQGDLKA